MEKLYTPDEVAAILRVKKSTIYDWVHFGKIGYTKSGGLKFTEAHISAFIAANSVPAKSRPRKAIPGKRRRSCRVPSDTVAMIEAAKAEVLHSGQGGSCAGKAVQN